MDYEKKYKEALGWMQSVYPTMTGSVKEDAEHYFPELRESEDERIRKELLNAFQESEDSLYMVLTPQRRKSFIAWLEKQGEKKPATIDIDKMVDDYANNKERGNEEFGKPVLCMIRAYRQGLNDAIEKVVLKSAWSEEDELMLLSIIQSLELTNGAAQIKIDWLKSFKQRYTWKPSDEQMKALDSVIDEYDGYPEFDSLVSLKNDLKKL